MKILYITNHNTIFRKSGGFINDYLNDLIFNGLKELEYENQITEVVDSTKIIHLYKENENKIDKKYIWGNMTSVWLLDKDTSDRSNLEQKIKDRYFDVVIYGSYRRCLDYYDIVSKCYDKRKIFLLDGNDDSDIQKLENGHLYFKRELYNNHTDVFPISFCMPTQKIRISPNKNKIKEYGTIIPGDLSTYIFKEESDYYNDYYNSYYGVTCKKAGWDCMRHYEIIGNYCMPYFLDIDDCPESTLTFLPKK